MTLQETIERNVRLALGDMHLQLVVANANNEDLREQIKTLQAEIVTLTPEEPPVANGKDKDKAKGPVPN
jgi:hypothetical protein